MRTGTETVKFYDPIYKLIIIRPKGWPIVKREFWEPTVGVRRKRVVDSTIVKVLKSVELARLNFLRQSGAAFLVFPSSSHTRFAHCLGTYHLGIEALNLSYVEPPESKGERLPLSMWLRGLGLEEEFLLSLLLHDVGHFPFSHVMENNHDLPFTLPSHEKMAAGYITGRDYSTAFAKYLRKEYGRVDFGLLSEILERLNKRPKKESINKGAICFLICKENAYLEGQKNSRELKMLVELTSGLLDLDRFDHYLRDAFFMGTNLARFNIKGFLADVTLTDDGIRLEDDGISHAISMLQSQESIRKYNFENHDNLAYEAMLNYCISRYFEKLKCKSSRQFERQKKEVAFWTDEELLSRINSLNLPDVKSIIFKIKSRGPYSMCGVYSNTNEIRKDVRSVLLLREAIISRARGKIKPEQLLFRIPRKYGQLVDLEGEWLSLNRLKDASGNRLADSESSVRREAECQLSKQKEHKDHFWVFTEGLDKTTKKEIDRILTGTMK